MNKYTRTPWIQELSTVYMMDKHDGDSGDTIVCSCIKREDAAFIVRAVNCHEELLDALKTWQKFWDTMPKGQMGKLSFDVGLFNDGFVKMGKAIAKAEGL